ncbi:DsbA family oxidoreductase [Arsenicibacter rosenii]|uniref:Disulfide bond formation protein DsbA n=1 Tax=Arsenicibacter rosenii TaxID=1750698 RepID=A0A1S2VIA7_9BACT|nr:DsbA family oxidoreductase [Arsenicibacter rosenii]OIN58481.1 disulfide bond formation protein DsbA [Arsenicibacter rosenii]
MEVEIWSDVMCPFCYIGKRKFEQALSQFPQRDQVKITWKSFLLNPDMQTDPDKTIHEYLAENKGWSVDQAKAIGAQVTEMAREVGLTYDFDRAVVANAINAHRVIQLAKTNGLGDAIEERLFRAYFTEGRNIDDFDTLIELATEIGLAKDDVEAVLTSDRFMEEVQREVYEAQQVGARGVPFFVLNRRYAVSGAQQTPTFLNALQTAWSEWEKTQPKPVILNDDASTCTPEDGCAI